MYFSLLPIEIFYEIALYLSWTDLINLSAVSSWFNHRLCDEPYFWFLMARKYRQCTIFRSPMMGDLDLQRTAAKNAKIDRELKKLADKYPGESFYTLYLAIKDDNIKLVKLLLNRGHEPNEIYRRGDTPLSTAVANGQTDIVNILLDYGANADLQGDWGLSPLSIAAKLGYADIVTSLISAGANTNKYTPMWFATFNGHANVVEIFLKSGVYPCTSLRAGDDDMLYIAAQEGHTQVVELLLKYGANKHYTRWGFSSALIAARHGHAEVVKLLLTAGVDKDHTNDYGDTLLLVAVRWGHKNVVELLLEFGVNRDRINRYRETPLLLAIRNGYQDIVELLI